MDKDTKWFSIRKHDQHAVLLEDHGRYEYLASEMAAASGSARAQYPQLVVFVGSTNAGKSTLIKLLIEQSRFDRGPRSGCEDPSPVVGTARYDSIPTSSDVHLYADPSTIGDVYPVLYADCEGFDGGERMPLGAELCRSRSAGEDGPDEQDSRDRSRLIEWASTEETQRREYIVSTLYPRFLYAFADCVVFVLRTAKTFGSAALTKLLDWAAVSMDKSVNQAVRPHCVVVLNATDRGVGDEQWDVERATEGLLSTLSHALDAVGGVPGLKGLAAYWRGLGRPVATVSDLIHCYYTSFRVVRVPQYPHCRAIDEQSRKLRDAIRRDCAFSANAKRDARMLATAGELQIYLSRGLDHFASGRDTAFDFLEVSLSYNPITRGFERQVVGLLDLITQGLPSHDQAQYDVKQTMVMFDGVAELLASCIVFDCIRTEKKGTFHELFPHYGTMIRAALAEYNKFHQRCTYRAGQRGCMLVQANHITRDHRDLHGPIASGTFQPATDDDFVHDWTTQVYSGVIKLYRRMLCNCVGQNSIDDAGEPRDQSEISTIHEEQLRLSYDKLGLSNNRDFFVGHSICFCCLMGLPEHALPCGHILCDGCVKSYGACADGVTQMARCPLSCDTSTWSEPLEVRRRSPGAGCRVLSLDGGGVRGVVQLEVLRAVENELGGMALNNFFDLIVGSGTGGIIAMKLARPGASVADCEEAFHAVCDGAYVSRTRTTALVNHITPLLARNRRHKPALLNDALQRTFAKDDKLFGSFGQFAPDTRVAVTATRVHTGRPVLLANYRRSVQDQHPRYDFVTGSEDTSLMPTWECGRATLLKGPKERYLAGKIEFREVSDLLSNPAGIAEAESRQIFPRHQALDVLLSLGTGEHRNKNGTSQTGHGRADWLPGRKRLRGMTAAEAQVGPSWNRTPNDRAATDPIPRIRHNPELPVRLPTFDDLNALIPLRDGVVEVIQQPHWRKSIRGTADCLLAKLFVWEPLPEDWHRRSDHARPCRITCRIPSPSPELQTLGELLMERCSSDFQPHFIVKERVGAKVSRSRMNFDLEQMRVTGLFASVFLECGLTWGQTTILACFSNDDEAMRREGYPIGGLWQTADQESAEGAASAVLQRSRPRSRGSNRYSYRVPSSGRVNRSKASFDSGRQEGPSTRRGAVSIYTSDSNIGSAGEVSREDSFRSGCTPSSVECTPSTTSTQPSRALRRISRRNEHEKSMFGAGADADCGLSGAAGPWSPPPQKPLPPKPFHVQDEAPMAGFHNAGARHPLDDFERTETDTDASCTGEDIADFFAGMLPIERPVAF